MTSAKTLYLSKNTFAAAGTHTLFGGGGGRGREVMQPIITVGLLPHVTLNSPACDPCLKIGTEMLFFFFLMFFKVNLEKEMATHSSILAWKIPWTEDPGRLQSMGSQRVRHD